MARKRLVRSSGVLAMAVATMLAFAPTPARASTGRWVPAAPNVFPSASSTVVASLGFIDGTQVGYFWSAARGDKVEQTFSGPATVNGILLKYTVPYNSLTTGNEVDWTISVNGVDVAKFRVVSGFTGSAQIGKLFPTITGPSYDVKIRVTNEVPSGAGSITLVYAGTSPHGFIFHT